MPRQLLPIPTGNIHLSLRLELKQSRWCHRGHSTVTINLVTGFNETLYVFVVSESDYGDCLWRTPREAIMRPLMWVQDRPVNPSYLPSSLEYHTAASAHWPQSSAYIYSSTNVSIKKSTQGKRPLHFCRDLPFWKKPFQALYTFMSQIDHGRIFLARCNNIRMRLRLSRAKYH